jgi:predicted  nucleic acid-binding Zn-ribbon protein
LGALARERDATIENARALEAKLKTAEAALSARDAELNRHKSSLEASLAAARSEHDQNADSIRKERDDLTAELAATRERTKALLSANEKEHRSSLTALAEERDAIRRDGAALAQRLAELRLEGDQKVAQHQQQIDALKAQIDNLTAETAKARTTFEQQSGVFATELKTVTDQRNKAVAAAEAAQKELQQKMSGIDESRTQIERQAQERSARLEREVTRLRRERDQLIEQRDELRDRIAGMAEDSQKLVKEIALHATKTAPLPTDVVQKPRESNVIDISEAEVLQPGEPDSGGVRPPRIRPFVVPPPNLRVL